MRFKKIYMFLVCVITAYGVCGKELLDVKFSPHPSLKSKHGIKKVVKINDLPGFSYALHLQTVKRNNKLSYVSWSRKFNPGNADRFIVDYWVKPVDRNSRYGLFVSNSGRQVAALLFRNNRIVCNNGGPWLDGAEYEVGKWQHIRYIINCIAQKYDVFLNDMQNPVVNGYKFRNASAGTPNSVWIESAEAGESTTLLGGVKINGESRVFPAKELAQAPFFVSGVNKVEKTLVIDGKGNDPDWKNANLLCPTRTDGQPICEKSTVKVLWDDHNLYMLFEGQAVKPGLREKGPVGNDVRVWKEDCFEFFIDPGKSLKTYYHFAGNASGGRYEAKCIFPRKDNKFNCSWQIKTVIGKKKWSAEVAIPFEAFQKNPKAGDLWGFNTGRENSYMKEVTSWSPLDNFHLPQKFGTLMFVDKNYLANQPSNIGKMLASKIYPVNTILIDGEKELKKMGQNIDENLIFKPRYEKYKKQFTKIKEKITNAKTFIAYFKQVQAARNLIKNIALLRVESIRYKMLFTPGSDGSKNGYIVSPESSMNKIFPKSYVGNMKKSISLCLAGNEYGSFQLAVISAKKYKINQIDVSVSDLKSKSGKKIASSMIKSFKVDYINTVFASKSQENIPDVLRKGRSFRYSKAKDVETLWFDVYVPRNTEAGIYHGTVTIKPNNKNVTTLSLTVKVYGFSLPKASSLKNVFCFMPYWAEMYYGKKITKEKRLKYFDFIMDHRLEPVNLWPRGGGMFMNEDELKYCIKRGKNIIILRIPPKAKGFKTKVAAYLKMLRKNKWMSKAIFFGHDEVLMFPKRLEQMKKMFKLAKKVAPQIPRLNTAHIDPKLYGYVDIWCPFFSNYNSEDAKKRVAKGSEVWWYPTDYPLKPNANFNLDSPGIDPRIIPWMNWKLNISGLLYWSINREWKTNGGQQADISDKIIKLRDLNWLTKGVKQKIKTGLRWPKIPWIPTFVSIIANKMSKTNGGGNLMYPGPDWQPLPSIRLKNLRDGMQDYEYFVILKKNLADMKKQSKDIQLIREIEAALSLDGNVVQSETSYTKDGKQLLMAKKNIADLILKTQKELNN